MAQAAPQTFENHGRIVPAYHMGAFGILVIYLFWSLYKVVRFFSADAVIGLLLAIPLFLIFFYARMFALTVQDRVIRLEMRLRLGELLPADLVPRIPELTHKQLVAMRFASDAELPALARRVLDERLTDGKTIKRLVKDWQADTLRA